MPTADALINKSDSLIRQYGGDENRTVYSRDVIEVGGDSDIGIPGTITRTEKLIDPQPFIKEVSPDDLIIGTGTVGQLQLGDLKLTFSANSLSWADLINPDRIYVIKYKDGSELTYRVLSHHEPKFQGTAVIITLYVRSTSS